MNNPNPFVPKGSLFDQQNLRRSRLKLAVFSVITICVTGLVAMLIQGCNREKPDKELNPPPLDLASNTASMDYTNPLPTEASNPPVTLPPTVSNPPVEIPPVAPELPPVAPVTSSEYTVVKGDYLAKIAKEHGVTTKALQAANPTVIPTKLKIGQKLVIPVGGTAAGGAAPAVAPSEAGGTSYTVKSGDTLTSIAKKYHTTYKAIEAANHLTTTKIKVGQKLKIPSKAEAAPAVPAPVSAPLSDTAPALPPISTPAPAPNAPGSGQ